LSVVAAFETVAGQIDSEAHDLSSNDVLALAAPHLAAAGFRVELGKKTEQKINVPVLFGLNGRLEKSFDADATKPAGSWWRSRPVAVWSTISSSRTCSRRA
jgi:hypothetical protein